MPKVALVALHEVEFWSGSDSYDRNMFQIVESIGEWTEVTDEELKLLRSYAHRVKTLKTHRIGVVVWEDYNKFRDNILDEIKDIVKEERKIQKQMEEEAAERQRKKIETAAKRKAGSLEKAKAKIMEEAQALGLKVVE
jgi:uncharacterized HAD superfamily protein